MKQEAGNEGKKPIKRRLRGMIARAAYMAFYSVSLVLLLACVGAWIASYRSGYYNAEVDLYSLHRNGGSSNFSQKYVLFDFMRGEATFQIGRNLWDRAPKVTFPTTHFEGEHVLSSDDGFMLPQNGWHQFRYEVHAGQPDNSMHSFGDSYASIAFPFWSAIIVLSIPFLILVVRRASRKWLRSFVASRRSSRGELAKDEKERHSRDFTFSRVIGIGCHLVDLFKIHFR